MPKKKACDALSIVKCPYHASELKMKRRNKQKEKKNEEEKKTQALNK